MCSSGLGSLMRQWLSNSYICCLVWEDWSSWELEQLSVFLNRLFPWPISHVSFRGAGLFVLAQESPDMCSKRQRQSNSMWKLCHLELPRNRSHRLSPPSVHRRYDNSLMDSRWGGTQVPSTAEAYGMGGINWWGYLWKIPSSPLDWGGVVCIFIGIVN